MLKLLSAITLLSVSLYSANWLMLQGTEKKIGHKPWGFSQLRYQDNSGDIVIKNGINKTPFSYIKPTLTKQSEIQLARTRIGLRGSLDDANKINYFLLTEIAPNGVNNPLDENSYTYVTDASITLKHLPVYIRAGRFKYAGSEEGHMARFVSPFIMFSTVGDQLMLERFTDTPLDRPSQGVGAYRDTGIQFFNTLPISDSSFLTLSYMIGNGSGLAYKNVNNDNYTHYGYLSYENILGKGKGYKQESLKLYAWYQEGKRELFVNNQSELYDRVRYGVGATYYKNKLRVEAEYMKGKGMIFTGAKDSDPDPANENWLFSVAAEKENEADGFYVLSTYRLLDNFEVIARYEEYNRLTNTTSTLREFSTLTAGFSYIFKNYDRVDFNYGLNKIEAPYNPSAHNLLKSVGNLLSFQYTIVIK